MNEYTIVVNSNKHKAFFKDNIVPLITGDYNSTKFKFEYDRSDGIKILKIMNPNNQIVYLDEIVNNEAVLVGHDTNNNPCSIFNENGDLVSFK